MSRRKRSVYLGFALAWIVTGTSLAQDSPPIIWTVPAHSHSIVSVSFSNDGHTIVSAAGDEAKSWQAADGAPLQTFPDHADGVLSAALSPDGQYLAVGYIVSGYPPGGVMDLWDISSETVMDTHGGCYVDFSPGGNFIASGGGGVNRNVYLHRVPSGEEIASYYNGPGYVTDLAYSPDRQLLAVANTNNTVRLWDTITHTTVRTLSGHTDDVSCIAFSPDGEYLAAGAGGWDLPSDSTIKLWRVSDGELLRTFTGHGQWTSALAFHPNGQILASSGRDSQTPYSASMRFWRVADGELIQEYDGVTQDIAYSPDGESYCYGTTDGTLVLAGQASTGITDDDGQIAISAPARLGQNYPNPFNPQTTITFTLDRPQRAKIAVYSLAGRLLAVLADRTRDAGSHAVVWNGKDQSGGTVPSGTYVIRLQTESGTEARKVMLLK